ncbi:hypothetical protein BDW67DRAFT_87334 [Aspergillus spinulosporus]
MVKETNHKLRSIHSTHTPPSQTIKCQSRGKALEPNNCFNRAQPHMSCRAFGAVCDPIVLWNAVPPVMTCVCDDSLSGDTIGSESSVVSGRQLKLNSSAYVMVVFIGVVWLIPVICEVRQSFMRDSEKANRKPIFVKKVAMVILSELVADFEEDLTSLRVANCRQNCFKSILRSRCHRYVHIIYITTYIPGLSVPGLFVLLIWIKAPHDLSGRLYT